ncbi:hypothetical protein GNZ12_37355 [Paraburkholderia sp. 1N]|uniref:Uncharacterized protein n=1 Tax=Paraburkholderia solitsugae TaxID=2675748 RepID=A0ABX2C1F5_9BURK|nr:hypothetical protein [Paraburkholderia solitsugae]NPT46880.1 hypothetical protein [Paraburkholderia solitsugae]
MSESIEDLLTRLQFRCLGLDEALRTGHEIMMVGTAFLADTCERTQT